MKTEIALSIEQMRELQSLGLDCSDASMAWLAKVDDIDHAELTTMAHASIQSDQWAWSPAYSLEDIICKLQGSMDWNSLVAERDSDPWLFDCRNALGKEVANIVSMMFWGISPMEAAFKAMKGMAKVFPHLIKTLEK